MMTGAMSNIDLQDFMGQIELCHRHQKTPRNNKLKLGEDKSNWFHAKNELYHDMRSSSAQVPHPYNLLDREPKLWPWSILCLF